MQDGGTSLSRTNPEELEAWSLFGSFATDLQRINLRLQERVSGKVAFWHAGNVLSGPLLPGPDGPEVPRDSLQALQDASRRFLQAAESLFPWHRTRLYIHPSEPPDDPYSNGVILEWHEPRPPVVEAIPLSRFSVGQWSGKQRVQDPRYSRAALDLSFAAIKLKETLAALAGRFDARLDIRTFEPPRAANN